jgi:ribose transport system permease protein
LVSETSTLTASPHHRRRQAETTIWRRIASLDQGSIVILIALFLAAALAIFLPAFASLGNLMTLLRSVSVLGILALGMTVVIIGRGIDLSQIAVAMVSAGIAVKLMIGGVTMPAALAVGLLAAFCLGLFNGAFVAFCGVPALFATLASGLLIIGIARITVLPLRLFNVPADNAALLALGQSWHGIPAPVLVFGFCVAGVHVFMSRTTLGRFIYAHGDNPETARFSGMPVRLLTLLEYSTCSVIGYVGGIVMVASTGVVDLLVVNRSMLVFDVIMVAVLGGVSLVGGRGNVRGVVAGALLVGVLLNAMTLMNLDYQLESIIKGAALLAAIVLDNWLHPRDEETAAEGE